MFIANNNNNNNNQYKLVQFTYIQYKIIMAIKTTESKNMPCRMSGINFSIMIISLMIRKMIYKSVT